MSTQKVQANESPTVIIRTAPDQVEADAKNLLSGIRGPVDIFTPINQEDLKRMVLQGNIPSGAFADCALFDDDDREGLRQHRLRQETARIAGVVAIINEASREDGPHPLLVLQMDLLALYSKNRIANATMVEAAAQYHAKRSDGTLTAEDARFLATQLNQAQDEIYPQVDPILAQQALETITAHVPGQETTPSIEILSRDTRDAWHTYLHEKYDAAFHQLYEEAGEVPIIGEQLVSMTQVFMARIGMPTTDDKDDFTKWKCSYDEAASGFRVNAGKKEVICGTRKKALTKLEFEKLMMHEVAVHAMRGELGSKTGFTIFQIGLPGYGASEEGFGLLIESLWSGESPDRLNRDHVRYAVTAYACGAYDDVLHNETETAMFAKLLVHRAEQDADTDELYRHVMRVFRGMPEGCRMRGNLNYLAGKIQMMHYVEDAFRRSVAIESTLTVLQSAKFNPLDEEHMNLKSRADQLTV